MFGLNYISAEEMAKKDKYHTLEQLRAMAKDRRECENCGQPAWRYGGLGMCFPCTTGESDGSNDYELVAE